MPSKKFKKRTLLIVFATCLSLLTSCALRPEVVQTNRSFQEFTTQLFQQEVASNTISLHFTLQDPSAFGISNAPVTFGSYDINVSASLASLENVLAMLKKFDYDSLSSENQITYDVLESYLRMAKEGARFALYEEPLNPITGIQAQLPILLAEFPFRTTEDVDIYLELLTTMPDYFESLIRFQQQKSEAGLFMPESSVDAVVAQSRSFIDSANDNFLHSSFKERLTSLDSLTEEAFSKYLARNKEHIAGYIVPAYEALVDGLLLLRGTGKNDQGLAHLPEGREFFKNLVVRQTGSSRDIETLQEMTLAQITADLQAIQDIIEEQPDTLMASQNITLEETNPIAILNDLEAKIDPIFPPGPKVTTRVKYVPEDMENYLSPAFYLIPTIDNISDNVIYINRGHTLEGLQLFTTLAHEGYPGHLYQTTFFASLNPDPIRNILNFGGYTEGWATYAEMCSYYLAPIDRDVAAIMQKNNSALLGLYAAADMGIHYGGWSLMDTASFFYDYGIEDMDVIRIIYQMIISNPANYLKYYIGYLEILELKKQAMEIWGDDFTQQKFHEAILTIGPAPFDVITKHIF